MVASRNQAGVVLRWSDVRAARKLSHRMQATRRWQACEPTRAAIRARCTNCAAAGRARSQTSQTRRSSAGC
eukprot:1048605-Prymnesium_polylepis.1